MVRKVNVVLCTLVVARETPRTVRLDGNVVTNPLHYISLRHFEETLLSCSFT